MPGPNESADIPQHESCGCVGLEGAVNFCPLHAAAPKLLELAEKAADYYHKVPCTKENLCPWCTVIAKVEGKE